MGGGGEPFRGDILLLNDVIGQMGSPVLWRIKVCVGKSTALREVQGRQPPLHVKDAMGKSVYHIVVAVCLLLGIVQGTYNHICTNLVDGPARDYYYC